LIKPFLDTLKVSGITLRVHALNALLIITTVHAQDFCDKMGDQLIGRQTIPTQLPEMWARSSIVVSIVIWSFVIANHASMWIVKTGFMILGLWLAGRFWMLRDSVKDRESYLLYTVRTYYPD
jgi:hypothetical protein